MVKSPSPVPETYVLDRQVGFLLRRATQRHLGIFASRISELTPTQFAALAKLNELGPVSQNALGRATAMDAATIKGVVDRLRDKGYLMSEQDENDRRRIVLAPTNRGRMLYEDSRAAAHRITAETLAPLGPEERELFVRLLEKLC